MKEEQNDDEINFIDDDLNEKIEEIANPLKEQ